MWMMAELTDGRIAGVKAEMRLEVDITVDDVRRAVKKLKNGKTPGVDRIKMKCIGMGGSAWLSG